MGVKILKDSIRNFNNQYNVELPFVIVSMTSWFRYDWIDTHTDQADSAEGQIQVQSFLYYIYMYLLPR